MSLVRPWRARAYAAVLVAVIATMSGQAAAKPARIVSMNLCADQLIMMLADPDRIASISHVAADPISSAMAAEAAGFSHNHGLAEEILALDPDLVVTSQYTTRITTFLLRELGYPVVELPIATDLDLIRANIRTTAAAIGEPARGAALVARFDADLAAIYRPPEQPLAVLYWANGLTSGMGTLADDVIRAAGFRNLAIELGMSGTSHLPLEVLLRAEPDVLVMGQSRDAPALANETFRHPALRRAFADRPAMHIPDRLWVCGTPHVAEAVRQLAALHDRRRPLRIGAISGP